MHDGYNGYRNNSPSKLRKRRSKRRDDFSSVVLIIGYALLAILLIV